MNIYDQCFDLKNFLENPFNSSFDCKQEMNKIRKFLKLNPQIFSDKDDVQKFISLNSDLKNFIISQKKFDDFSLLKKVKKFGQLFLPITEAQLESPLSQLYFDLTFTTQVIFPKDILPGLSEYLLATQDYSQLINIAKCLCREINEMTMNPGFYEGKSKNFQLEAEPHLNCWMEMDASQEIVRFFILPRNEPFASGTNFQVYKAQRF